MAVGTPGAEDVDDQRLAGKLRTALVHCLACRIDAAEAEGLLRIFHLRQGLGQRVRIGGGFVLAALGGKGLKRHDAALLALQRAVRQNVPSIAMHVDAVEAAQVKVSDPQIAEYTVPCSRPVSPLTGSIIPVTATLPVGGSSFVLLEVGQRGFLGAVFLRPGE